MSIDFINGPLDLQSEIAEVGPSAPFDAAVEQALAYRMFDFGRLERPILERVAGDFFTLLG